MDRYEAKFGLYQRPFQLTCAQARVAMEAIATGSLARKFRALRQASTMSPQRSKTVMAGLLARRKAQTFSTGEELSENSPGDHFPDERGQGAGDPGAVAVSRPGGGEGQHEACGDGASGAEGTEE